MVQVAHITRVLALLLAGVLLTGEARGRVCEFFGQMPKSASLAPNIESARNCLEPIPIAKAEGENRELVPLAIDEEAIHVIVLITPTYIKLLDSFTDFGSFFHAAQIGSVTFEGLDATGTTLFVADGPFSYINKGDTVGSSIVDVPVSTSLVDRLVQLRVSYMGLSLTQKSLPTTPPVAEAKAIDAHHVRVTFDGRYFGSITVRPSATSSGDSQPFSGDGTARSGGVLENDYADLYVDFTDGIKTVASHVKIHVSGR